MERDNEKAIMTSAAAPAPKATTAPLRDIADRAFQFLCGLNLQDHPVKDQREQRDVVSVLKKTLMGLRVTVVPDGAWSTKTTGNIARAVPPGGDVAETAPSARKPDDISFSSTSQTPPTQAVLVELADVLQQGLRRLKLPMFDVVVVNQRIEVRWNPRKREQHEVKTSVSYDETPST